MGNTCSFMWGNFYGELSGAEVTFQGHSRSSERIMEHSFSRLFVPKSICSHGGTFVLGNEWSIDHRPVHRMVHRPFVPWTVHSREWKFPIMNEPWTFRSSDHLFTGTFVPKYKKVVKLVFSAVPGLAVPKSSSIMGTVISTSAGCSISGVTSVSGQDSTFYFRNCGVTSVTLYLWHKDHGGGRFCSTDGARMRHYRRRRELSSCQIKSDSLRRLIQPMLHVGTVSKELLWTTQPKWHYRIYLERRYSTYGKDHGLSASVKQS